MTVPLPRQVILEKNKGTIRCQNRGDDGQLFHSYITNAVSMHITLNFDPLLPEDQGECFCCAQNGLCSITMTTVIITRKLYS